MSNQANPDQNINVAAVCGKQVRIYGDVEDNGKRPLRSIINFSSYGAARLFATEHDEMERIARARRTSGRGAQ